MSLARLFQAAGLRDADDTGMNFPEKKKTLLAQQRALLEGRQKAQMFPLGTDELDLPEGFSRLETPRGVFHFDPEQTSADEIARVSADGRENEVLGLGPASKADVAMRASAGEPVAAMVERDPAGDEVKAALVTPGTEPSARREMQARAAPDSRVVLEPTERVVADRPGGLAALMQAGGVASGGKSTAAVQAPDAPGAMRGAANSFRRGAIQAEQAIDAAGFTVATAFANDAAREPEKVAYERRHDRAPNRANFARWGKGADHAYGVSLQKWQAREDAREERLRNNARFVEVMRGRIAPNMLGKIARDQKRIEAIPQSAGKEAFDQAEGLGDSLRAVVTSPVQTVSGIVAESVPASIPSLAGGALGSFAGPGGTAIGAGLPSLLAEYGSTVVQELQAQGVDVEKPETVEALLKDPERLAAARAKWPAVSRRAMK
jgi:hypothetical protein